MLGIGALQDRRRAGLRRVAGELARRPGGEQLTHEERDEHGQRQDPDELDRRLAARTGAPPSPEVCGTKPPRAVAPVLVRPPITAGTRTVTATPPSARGRTRRPSSSRGGSTPRAAGAGSSPSASARAR